MTTDQNTPPESLGSPESTKDSNFISSPETSKVDTIYSDFFQETSDGKISMGSKAKKS